MACLCPAGSASRSHQQCGLRGISVVEACPRVALIAKEGKSGEERGSDGCALNSICHLSSHLLISPRRIAVQLCAMKLTNTHVHYYLYLFPVELVVVDRDGSPSVYVHAQVQACMRPGLFPHY